MRTACAQENWIRLISTYTVCAMHSFVHAMIYTCNEARAKLLIYQTSTITNILHFGESQLNQMHPTTKMSLRKGSVVGMLITSCLALSSCTAASLKSDGSSQASLSRAQVSQCKSLFSRYGRNCGLKFAQVACMVRLAGISFSLFHPADYRAGLWYRLHWVVREEVEWRLLPT